MSIRAGFLLAMSWLASKDPVEEIAKAGSVRGQTYGEIDGLCSHCNRYTLIAQAYLPFVQNRYA